MPYSIPGCVRLHGGLVNGLFSITRHALAHCGLRFSPKRNTFWCTTSFDKWSFYDLWSSPVKEACPSYRSTTLLTLFNMPRRLPQPLAVIQGHKKIFRTHTHTQPTHTHTHNQHTHTHTHTHISEFVYIFWECFYGLQQGWTAMDTESEILFSLFTCTNWKMAQKLGSVQTKNVALLKIL